MKSFAVTFVSLFVCALFITAAASLVVPAQAKEPQPVMICVPDTPGRERKVRRVPPAGFYKDEAGAAIYTINGNEPWRRTEIEVKRGQKIEISANGIVRWAPDGIEKIDVTPDGTRPPYRGGWNYYHFPYPEAGIGSLVMRIGKGIYPAGSSVVIEAEEEGFVEFMVNDDRLDDNSGLFYVQVNVRP